MQNSKLIRISASPIQCKGGYIYFPATHQVAHVHDRKARLRPCETDPDFKDMSYIPQTSIFHKAYISRGAALIEFSSHYSCYEFIFENSGQQVELDPHCWYHIKRSDFEVQELANRPCVWQEAYIA
jgi:hypothetical protein